jgi:hypothetical protein
MTTFTYCFPTLFILWMPPLEVKNGLVLNCFWGFPRLYSSILCLNWKHLHLIKKLFLLLSFRSTYALLNTSPVGKITGQHNR